MMHYGRLAGTAAWTPELVAGALVEAVRWVSGVGPAFGPVKPRALMPTFVPTNEDREEEGWGPPEIADPQPIPNVRRYTARQVGVMIEAIYWPARYVARTNPDSAVVLSLWVGCMVSGRNFGDAIRTGRAMSRASAYRLRNRALSLIAAGLTRDRVPTP